MVVKNGFTIIEVLTTMMIIAVLAAIAIPSLSSSIMMAKVKAVENNLRTIASGQEKYFEDHTGINAVTPYYYSPGSNQDFSNINKILTLSLSDQTLNDGFIYTCANAGSPTTCPTPPCPVTGCLVCCTATSNTLKESVSVDISGNLTCYSNGAAFICPDL